MWITDPEKSVIAIDSLLHKMLSNNCIEYKYSYVN